MSARASPAGSPPLGPGQLRLAAQALEHRGCDGEHVFHRPPDGVVAERREHLASGRVEVAQAALQIHHHQAVGEPVDHRVPASGAMSNRR